MPMTYPVANIKTIFGIDLRSLALFRISLASMIIIDLLFRLRDLKAFYTDNGVLTRIDSITYASEFRTSLHWLSGAEWTQGLLFLVAGVLAFCLLVGYRCRVSAIMSYVLLMSLQNRNEFLTNGGDNLLMVMSFWAMFLPIGARYSVDAALSKTYKTTPNASINTQQRYFSIITIAVLLQVMYLYFFTAVLKTGDAWRVSMDAAWYAVNLDQYATLFGRFLRDFPGLLTFGTYFVWYLEILAIIFIFSPIFHTPLRILTLVLLIIMHAAFFFSLHIVLFPLIDLVSLTIFLPSAFWDWLQEKFKSERREKIRIYYDEDCGFCLKTCLILRMFLLPSSVAILPAQSDSTIYSVMQRENSWVVVDHTGKQHIHWHGVQYLFMVSVLFWPIGLLMNIAPLMKLGNQFYRWVGNNRYRLSQYTETLLPYRTVNVSQPWLIIIVGAYFFYVVTYINIAGVKEWKVSKPQHVLVTEKIFRLDQRWDMFAPYPLIFSEMPVITGHTRSGKEVDVYNMTMEPPSWEWPELLSWEFENYRWRKYLGRVRSYKTNTIREGYGAYLCRRWNDRKIPTSDELASFEIYFVRKKSMPPGEKRPESTIRAWRHWCFASYAPGEPGAFLK